MTFKGTPGEWHIETYSGEQWIAAGEDIQGNVICNQPEPDLEESLKYWEANAHLIAAAPDLLEACMKLAEWDKKHPAGRVYPDHEAKRLEQELTEIVNQAKAAIDKALNYQP
jgi:hypothetical protein